MGRNFLSKLTKLTLVLVMVLSSFFGVSGIQNLKFEAKSTSFKIGEGATEYTVQKDSPEVDGGENVRGQDTNISFMYDPNVIKAKGYNMSVEDWNNNGFAVSTNIAEINAGRVYNSAILGNGNLLELNQHANITKSGNKIDGFSVKVLDKDLNLVSIPLTFNNYTQSNIEKMTVEINSEVKEVFSVASGGKYYYFDLYDGHFLERQDIKFAANSVGNGSLLASRNTKDSEKYVGRLVVDQTGTPFSGVYFTNSEGEYELIKIGEGIVPDGDRIRLQDGIIYEKSLGNNTTAVITDSKHSYTQSLPIPGDENNPYPGIFVGLQKVVINDLTHEILEHKKIDYSNDLIYERVYPTAMTITGDSSELIMKKEERDASNNPTLEYYYDIIDSSTLEKKYSLGEEFSKIEITEVTYNEENGTYMLLGVLDKEIPEQLGRYVDTMGPIAVVLNKDSNDQFQILSASSINIPNSTQISTSVLSNEYGTLYRGLANSSVNESYINWTGSTFYEGRDSEFSFYANSVNDYASKLPKMKNDLWRVQLGSTMTQSEVDRAILGSIRKKMEAKGANLSTPEDSTYIYDDNTSDYDLYRRINKNPLEQGFRDKPINWEDFGLRVKGIDDQTGQKIYEVGEYPEVTLMTTDSAMNQTVTSMKIEVIDENTELGPLEPEGDINSDKAELKLHAKSFEIFESEVKVNELTEAKVKAAGNANIKGWHKVVTDTDTGAWKWQAEATQANLKIDEQQRKKIRSIGVWPLDITYERNGKKVTRTIQVYVKADDVQTGPEGGQDPEDHQFATFAGKGKYAKYEVKNLGNINKVTGASIVDVIPTKYTEVELDVNSQKNQSVQTISLLNAAGQVIASTPQEVQDFVNNPQIGKYKVVYFTKTYKVGEGSTTEMDRGGATFTFEFEVTENPVATIEILEANRFEVVEADTQLSEAELTTLVKQGVTAKDANGANAESKVVTTFEKFTASGNTATGTTLASINEINTVDSEKLPYKVTFTITDEQSGIATKAYKWIYVHEKGNTPKRGTEYILQANGFNKLPSQVSVSNDQMVRDGGAYSLLMSEPIKADGQINYGQIGVPAKGGYSSTPGGYKVTFDSFDGKNAQGFDRERIKKEVIVNVSNNDFSRGLDFQEEKTIYVKEVVDFKANLKDKLNVKAWNPATGDPVVPTITYNAPELTEAPGDYEIKIKNPTTNAEGIAKVKVVTADAPIIQLKAEHANPKNEVRLPTGGISDADSLRSYVEVLATDEVGGVPALSPELLAKTTPTGAIGTDPGVYLIKYNVTNDDKVAAPELTVRFIVGGSGQKIGDYEFFGHPYKLKHEQAGLIETQILAIQSNSGAKIVNTQTGMPAPLKLDPATDFKVASDNLVPVGVYTLNLTTEALEASHPGEFFNLQVVVHEDEAEVFDKDDSIFIINGRDAMYRPSVTGGKSAEELVGLEVIELTPTEIKELGLPQGSIVNNSGYDKNNPVKGNTYPISLSHTLTGIVTTSKNFNLSISAGELPRLNRDQDVIKVPVGQTLLPMNHVNPTDAEDDAANIPLTTTMLLEGSTLDETTELDTQTAGTTHTVSYTVVDSDGNTVTELITFVVDDGSMTIVEGNDYNLILSATSFNKTVAEVATTVSGRKDQIRDETGAKVSPRKPNLPEGVLEITENGYKPAEDIYKPLIQVAGDDKAKQEIIATVLDKGVIVGNYIFEQTGTSSYRYSQAKDKNLAELLTFKITNRSTSAVLDASEYTIAAKDSNGVAYQRANPVFDDNYTVEVTTADGTAGNGTTWLDGKMAITRGVAPEITLDAGTEFVSVNLGAQVNVLDGVTGLDTEEGSVNVHPTPATLNTTVPGRFAVTYNATDSDLNEAEEKTRVYFVGADDVADYTLIGQPFVQVDVSELPLDAQALKIAAELEIVQKDPAQPAKDLSEVTVDVAEIDANHQPGDRVKVAFTLPGQGAKETVFEIVKDPEIPTNAHEEFVMGDNVNKRVSELGGYELHELVNAKVMSRTLPQVENLQPNWTKQEIRRGGKTGPVVNLSDIAALGEIIDANRHYTILLQTDKSTVHSFSLSLIDGESPSILFADSIVYKKQAAGTLNVLSDVTAQEADTSTIDKSKIDVTIDGVTQTDISLTQQGVYNVEYTVKGIDNIEVSRNRVFVIGNVLKDTGTDGNEYIYYANQSFDTRINDWSSNNTRILQQLSQDGLNEVKVYSITPEFVATPARAEIKDATAYKKEFGQYPITLGVKDVDQSVTSTDAIGLVTHLSVDHSKDYHIDVDSPQEWRPSQLKDVDNGALKDKLGIHVYNLNDATIVGNADSAQLGNVFVSPSWNVANPQVGAYPQNQLLLLGAATQNIDVTIKAGNKPTITQTAKETTVLVDEVVDLNDFVEIADTEDDAEGVALDVEIYVGAAKQTDSGLNTQDAKVNIIKYVVTDSDGNTANYTFTVIVDNDPSVIKKDGRYALTAYPFSRTLEEVKEDQETLNLHETLIGHAKAKVDGLPDNEGNLPAVKVPHITKGLDKYEEITEPGYYFLTITPDSLTKPAKEIKVTVLDDDTEIDPATKIMMDFNHKNVKNRPSKLKGIELKDVVGAWAKDKDGKNIAKTNLEVTGVEKMTGASYDASNPKVGIYDVELKVKDGGSFIDTTMTTTVEVESGQSPVLSHIGNTANIAVEQTRESNVSSINVLDNIKKSDVEDEEDNVLQLDNILAVPNQIDTSIAGSKEITYTTIDRDGNVSNTLKRTYHVGSKSLGDYAVTSRLEVSQSTSEVSTEKANVIAAAGATITPIGNAPIADFANPLLGQYGQKIDGKYILGDFPVTFTVEGDLTGSSAVTTFVVHDGKNIPNESDDARIIAYDQEKYLSELKDGTDFVALDELMGMKAWKRDSMQTPIPMNEITAVIRNSKGQKVNIEDITDAGNYKVTFTYNKKATVKTEQTLTITKGDAPKIILGDTQTKFPLGTPIDEDFFKDAVTIEDAEDEQTGFETKLVVTGWDVIDTNVEGAYKVSYHAIDGDGNASDIKTRVYIFGDLEVRGNYIFEAKPFIEQHLSEVSSHPADFLRAGAKGSNIVIKAKHKDTLDESPVEVLVDVADWNAYTTTTTPGKFLVNLGVEAERNAGIRSSILEMPVSVTSGTPNESERYHIEAQTPQEFYVSEARGENITTLLGVRAWDKASLTTSEIVEPVLYQTGGWNVASPAANDYNVVYKLDIATTNIQKTVAVKIKSGDAPVIQTPQGTNIKVAVGESVNVLDYVNVVDTEEGNTLVATATHNGQSITTLTSATEQGLKVTYTVTDRDGNDAQPVTINYIFTDNGSVGKDYTLSATDFDRKVEDVSAADDLKLLTQARAVKNDGGADGNVDIITDGGYKAEHGVYRVELQVREDERAKRTVSAVVIDETIGQRDGEILLGSNGTIEMRPSVAKGKTLKEIFEPTAQIIETGAQIESKFLEVSSVGYDSSNPQVGTYTVTIESKHPGYPGSITRPFEIITGSKPVVTFDGQSQVIALPVGSPTPNLAQDVHASDVDGDTEIELLKTLNTVGNVNTAVPGKYEVTYQVTDIDKNKSELVTRYYFVGADDINPAAGYIVTSKDQLEQHIDDVDTDKLAMIQAADVKVFVNPLNPGSPEISLPIDLIKVDISTDGYGVEVDDYFVRFSIVGDNLSASTTRFGVYDDSAQPIPPTPGKAQKVKADNQTKRLSEVTQATNIYTLMDAKAWNRVDKTPVDESEIKVLLGGNEIQLADLQAQVKENKNYDLTFKTAQSDAVKVRLTVKEAGVPMITVSPQMERVGLSQTAPNFKAGVTAEDADDQTDLTGQVQVVNPDDFKPNKPGIYTIKYEVTGIDGNKGTAERVYIVGDTKPSGDYEFYAQNFEVSKNAANPATILRDAKVEGKNEVEVYHIEQDADGNTIATKKEAIVVNNGGYTGTPGVYIITLGVKGVTGAEVEIIASVVEGTPELEETIAISVKESQTHRLSHVKGKSIVDLNNEVETLFGAKAWNKETGAPVDVAIVSVPWDVTNPQPGTYTLEFYAAGRINNKSITVELTAGKEPVLEIKPNAEVIKKGTQPNFLTGVKATDEEDGDLVVAVNAGAFDANVTGPHKVIYTATDTDGNTVTGARVYIIIDEDDEKPVDPVIGESHYIDARNFTIDDNLVAKTEADKNGQVISRAQAVAISLDTLTVDGTVEVVDLGGYNEKAGTYTVLLKAVNETGRNVPATKVQITVVDVTPPAKPTVNAAHIEAYTENAITGKAEAESKVEATLPNGTTLNAMADSEGNWELKIPALNHGEEVSFTAQDAAGNVSDATVVKVLDTIAPDMPIVNTVEPGDDSMISGKAEAGSTVEITLPDGTVLTTTPDANGDWSIISPISLGEKEQISVVAQDAAGNVSNAAIVIVGEFAVYNIDAKDFTMTMKELKREVKQDTLNDFVKEKSEAKATKTKDGVTTDLPIVIDSDALAKLDKPGTEKVTIIIDAAAGRDVATDFEDKAETEKAVDMKKSSKKSQPKDADQKDDTRDQQPPVVRREVTVKVTEDGKGGGNGDKDGGKDGRLPSTGENILETLAIGGVIFLGGITSLLVIKKRKQTK